jgi:AraC-like DNA-binding protein
LKFKHSNSIFWEYVLVCTVLALITCVCIGAVLGTTYLRTVNNRNAQMIQSQATQAISALDAQIDSMHQLALRFSTQRIYQASHVLQHKYNALTTAQALSQYQTYCPLATQFALMYPTGDDVFLYQQDGTTTELAMFLSRYELADSPAVRDFLFVQTDSCRIFRAPGSVLIAYPVTAGAGKVDATLCFVIQNTDLQDFVHMSSALPQDTYRLVLRGSELLSCDIPSQAVSAGKAEAFRIDVAVPRLSLVSLISSPPDILMLAGCLALLFVSIFALAWRCYRPIRSLSRKHSTDTTSGIKNELQALDQIITQTKNHTLLLDKKASDQSALLQDYVLLMLLNNSGSINIVQDLANAGIDLPNSHFAVITLTPCKDQIITQENMDTLQQNLLDVTGDIGSMYVVKCSHTSHILAIICNPETPELYEVLIQRLHTYLGTLARRFLVGTGPLTDRLAGISASYLTALSQLRTLANAQPPAIVANTADTGALINRIVSQIECGDCPQALVNLEAYMAVIEQNQSELIRRSNVLSITFAIQQLCGKLNFRLTESQMGMLLSMRSVKTIHFALLQLIPPLCIHAQKQNDEAILPTGRLVMDYLNNHFSDYDISVQQVAEAVGIGINRTSAIIREATGHSFKTVLAQLRITQAKKLLSSGSTVADVASQVGYNSASYFIKVFKSAEGITPDAYRKSRYGDDGQPEPPDEEDP